MHGTPNPAIATLQINDLQPKFNAARKSGKKNNPPNTRIHTNRRQTTHNTQRSSLLIARPTLNKKTSPIWTFNVECSTLNQGLRLKVKCLLPEGQLE
jgi:hypothetical protein